MDLQLYLLVGIAVPTRFSNDTVSVYRSTAVPLEVQRYLLYLV
jgi:hypothetical protein